MTTPLIYQLIHKPAFHRQLLALPRKDAELVIDKTELLSYNPAPDAKNKKRIVSFKRAIFRIRAGRYRILYAFDANEGWVQILGVDDRKDVYRNGDLIDGQEISLGGLPDDDDPFERETPEPDQRRRPPFDGVVVDEAQDLEPTAIRLLVTLCRSSDRLFLTADPNQAIYGSRFRWADVHEDLQFRGRTGVLRKNYRSTRQIIGAAERYLAGAELESSEGPAECPREGALPMVRAAASREAEMSHIVDFLRGTTRELRVGLGGCAVLVPSRQAGFEMVQSLTACGVTAQYMERQEIDLDLPVVKVMTRHAAKGLEFPIVAVTGLLTPPRPVPGATDEQLEDARQVERRIFYVAMTRAMDRLMVVIPGDQAHPGTAAFDPERWDIGGDLT